MCINYALEQNQSNAIRSCALKPREITDVPLAPSRFFPSGRNPGGQQQIKAPDYWQHGKQNAQFSPVIRSSLFIIMTLPFLVSSTSNLHVARV